jgi:hypothetical protein
VSRSSAPWAGSELNQDVLIAIGAAIFANLLLLGSVRWYLRRSNRRPKVSTTLASSAVIEPPQSDAPSGPEIRRPNRLVVAGPPAAQFAATTGVLAAAPPANRRRFYRDTLVAITAMAGAIVLSAVVLPAYRPTSEVLGATGTPDGSVVGVSATPSPTVEPATPTPESTPSDTPRTTP